ncbi:FAS-associated death domain protein-like [Acipenser oxyrinchus oxyrinchus]|uniref:FAS-associated death domain protein n=1 Tax=Acipenser oxyrinchus oxyrinchus TaxID=40147 RepID=A0AAD8G1K7_ACIOX|nr:FAS-associated death domain protein-like [Acipenser oxyrinchus oxyrinchus]
MGEFLGLLYQISRSLDSENLKNLKFLCGRDIGKKELEKISSGTDLFKNLMEQEKISIDNTGFLRFLLTSIKREDLLEKLENFEKYGSGERDDLPDALEIERLETAFEVICDNLGKQWKMFARKIGVSDAKLDQIQDRHPRDMREQIRQVLKAWQKVQGKDAKAAELIEKLRDCRLNLVADNVDKQLRTMHN